MAALTYKRAGVDIEAADRLVSRITRMTRATLNRRVKTAVGGYASLFALDRAKWIAASTDGVGTKLKLAFELGVHDTVGVDLVAMSVNDLICVGAKPLFFLDYFATGKLRGRVADDVIAGVVRGCREAGCALVGGETAEMPGIYAPGEYDLAGFAVGEVRPAAVLPRKARPGDVILGVSSSGAHSNGFSLLRKLLPTRGAERKRWARALLAPTRIYVRTLSTAMADPGLVGLAHITGSGFLNLPRVSDRVSYRLTLSQDPSENAALWSWVRDRSALGLKELSSTFNLGFGMLVVARADSAQRISMKIKKMGGKVQVLGEVERPRTGRGSEIEILSGRERAVLKYS